MKEVNHEELNKLIQVVYIKKLPLFIWGTFGIGKSTAVKEFTLKKKIGFIDVRISQLEPSDLRGLPSLKDDKTKWLPPSWLPSEGNGVLFFDEINLAPPAIQSAAYQLILDRQLGEYKLPEGWIIISAGNREQDHAHVFSLAAPLLNRFVHCELRVPDIDDWIKWAFDNDVDSRIVTYLKWKEGVGLFRHDGKYKDKSIPTPRSWEFCSRMIKDVVDLRELHLLVSSAVGEAMATELEAFIKLQKKVNLREILNNPKKVKEIKEISLKYSMLSALVEYYRKNKDKKILEKLCEVSMNLEPEYTTLLLRFAKMTDEKFFKSNIVKFKKFVKFSAEYMKYIV